MSELTPPPPGAYPRPGFQGSPENADKIEALANGYWGMSWVFLVNVLMVVPLNLSYRSIGAPVLLAAIPLVGLVVGFMSYPKNKLIGQGKGWSDGIPILASVLMGLNSALCCGIIGFAVMQSIAASEMKKLGVPPKSMRRKAWVMEYVASLRASTPVSGPPPPQ